jgi:molybdate transport system substrate-binding protein
MPVGIAKSNWAVAGMLLLGALGTPGAARAEPVKVFAAASLKDALDAVAKTWAAENPGKSVVASYAASSALAKQVEAGAPADLFVSADLDWMDELDGKGLVAPGTRKSLLGNSLVLVAPAGSGVKLEPKEGADFSAALAGGKLAVADVKAVPAGKYAKAALEKLGLWAGLEPSLAQAENVRAALALVARGEAKLGIVYATDAKSEPKVEVVGVFPEASHPPIVYPVAELKAAANPDARAFLAFVEGPEAGAIFKAGGFDALK